MANAKATPTLSFTLPLSCQICLGKVKHPVSCPNQHVFCGTCMDVWLQRNSQCPACRVTINEENPARRLLGGLHQMEETNDSFANKDFRRARMELLYKEYEEEIQRLIAELKVQKIENECMSRKLSQGGGGATGQTPAPSADNNKDSCHQCKNKKTVDPDVIMVLTKKLQDAQILYDRIKGDMKKFKQENTKLKTEQDQLQRENQGLRLELGHRSPKKYGRYTVAALEAELERERKKISQLEQALERSDAHIEELEKELSQHRGDITRKRSPNTMPSNNIKNEKDIIKRNLFLSDTKKDKDLATTKFDGKYFLDKNNCDENMKSKKDTFSASQENSFMLEFPSNLTPSSTFEQTSNGIELNSADTTGLVAPDPDLSMGSNFIGKKALNFDEPQKGVLKRSEDLTSAVYPKNTDLNKKVNFLLPEKPDHEKTNNIFDIPNKGKQFSGDLSMSALDESEADTSFSPELKDCLELLTEAERKVNHVEDLIHQPRPQSVEPNRSVPEIETTRPSSAPGIPGLYPNTTAPRSFMSSLYGNDMANSYPPINSISNANQFTGSDRALYSSLNGYGGQGASVMSVNSQNLHSSLHQSTTNFTAAENRMRLQNPASQSVPMTTFLKSTADYRMFSQRHRPESPSVTYTSGMFSQQPIGGATVAGQGDMFTDVRANNQNVNISGSIYQRNYHTASVYDFKDQKKRLGDFSDFVPSPTKSSKISQKF